MSAGPPYRIDDPRPYALASPYTFFLPSDAELAAVSPGDMVKLIFRSETPDRQWDAERMWVTIESADGDRLQGRLDTQPDDMPGVVPGDIVRFERHQIIACVWDEERAAPPPEPPVRREYWDRCMVDSCVLEEGARVHYLYREERDPDLELGDRGPDSGWRIRGDYRGLPDEEIEAREGDYVALGAVLNVDDSWIDLIDAPVGAAFIRDWESDRFLPSA